MTPINENIRPVTYRALREINMWVNLLMTNHLPLGKRYVAVNQNKQKFRVWAVETVYPCAVINDRTFWPACSHISPMVMTI